MSYAGELGIDTRALQPALREQVHGPLIDRDLKLAQALGISATPSFIVDRFILEGAQSKHRFERLIRRVLRRQSTLKAQPNKK
jgi:predicted DsbA family dithiol-disulfide isomerase